MAVLRRLQFTSVKLINWRNFTNVDVLLPFSLLVQTQPANLIFSMCFAFSLM